MKKFEVMVMHVQAASFDYMNLTKLLASNSVREVFLTEPLMTLWN